MSDIYNFLNDLGISFNSNKVETCISVYTDTTSITYHQKNNKNPNNRNKTKSKKNKKQSDLPEIPKGIVIYNIDKNKVK